MSSTLKIAVFMIVTAHMPVWAFADVRIEGRVEADGAPISGAEVTVWLAGSSAPQELVTATTNGDGSFRLTIADERDDAGVLYLIAQGGEAKTAEETGPNAATTLMATLGSEPPERVIINELTTVASAWTAAQFLDGDDLSGNSLGSDLSSWTR